MRRDIAGGRHRRQGIGDKDWRHGKHEEKARFNWEKSLRMVGQKFLAFRLPGTANRLRINARNKKRGVREKDAALFLQSPEA
jgi:hypothetical protein